MFTNLTILLKAVITSCLLVAAVGAVPVKPGPIDKDAPKEFKSTKSGLKYRVLRKSKKAKPKADSRVRVHYRGWLPDKQDPNKGREFDSSYSRGESISFSLNGVIEGWSEGLQLLGTGGMVELEIPPQLGYGASGFGNANQARA